MANYFQQARNVELSTIYYLEQQINASWSNVNVVKSFTQVYDKPLPVVCIQLDSAARDRLEIGSNTLDNTYTITIDIFARSDGQRIDLADFIIDKLKDNWVYYIHSHKSGSPTELERTADGKVQLLSIIEDRKLEILPNLEEKDRFRHLITISVKKS